MKIRLHIILCLKWFMKIGGNDWKLKDSPEIYSAEEALVSDLL